MPSGRTAQLCGKIIEFVVSRAVGFTEFSVFPTAPVLWWVSLISEEWGHLRVIGGRGGRSPVSGLTFVSDTTVSEE